MVTAAATDSGIDRLEGGAGDIPLAAGMLPMVAVATLGFTAFILFRVLLFKGIPALQYQKLSFLYFISPKRRTYILIIRVIIYRYIMARASENVGDS
jgi:hypothetical protein